MPFHNHKIIILFVVFAACGSLQSQTYNGRVLDQKTREPLAFVSIVEQGSVNGTYSDIDGRFALTMIDTSSVVLMNLVGYESLNTKYASDEFITVRLKEKENLLNEIVIRPSVNPAERIMTKVIERRKINNPESDIAFTYDSYNKLVFGANPDSTTMADSAKFAALDSSTQEAYKFLSDQYLFMMESATQRKFYPPDKSEETIIANRVSGLKTTEFFLLGTQLQSFSFYGQSVDLLGVTYMSPLAEQAISKYLFILEDSTFIDTDTVYTISFQPRKGKNFEGMKGQLFINTNGYALQNVIAEPAENTSIQIRIQQQYELIDNRKWFPKQLNSAITFRQFIIGSEPMTGEGRSYIKNVKLDPPLRQSEFTPVTLLILPKAGTRPDSVWNQYREHELDNKELKTYHFIDSLGKAENFERKMKGFEALTTGQLNLGPVSFDLNQLMRFNSYEGFRLGGGLRTSNLVSDKFSVGGYYAYGFRDTHSKYGGDALIHLYRKRNAWVKFAYSNDVMEMGGNQLDLPIQGFKSTQIYPFFISRMDRREKKEITVNGRLINNVTLSAFANDQYVKTFEPYHFTDIAQENVKLHYNQFNLTEAGFQIRYSPGEKLVRLPTRELSLGGRFPVFYFKFTHGFNDLLNGDIKYSRFDFRAEKTFNIQNIGLFTIMTVAGYVPDDAPLSLLYNARGSWQKFTIAAANSFETMRTNEFQHSQFVAVHLRHNFSQLLLKSKYFAPNIVLVHNMMWGKMDFTQSHSFPVNTTSLGYTESGVQLDNLMHTNISGIGIGVFYRYGAYHMPTMLDNFAFKLTSSFTF